MNGLRDIEDIKKKLVLVNPAKPRFVIDLSKCVDRNALGRVFYIIGIDRLCLAEARYDFLYSTGLVTNFFYGYSRIFSEDTLQRSGLPGPVYFTIAAA